MSVIERIGRPLAAIALTNSQATSGRIQFATVAGGSFICTALATGVSITWYGAMEWEGTAYPIYDHTGTILTRSVAASRAYPIPDECFGFPVLVPVLDAGTATIIPSVKG